MDTTEVASFLARVALFKGMQEADLDLLAGICEQAAFEPEEILIEEGAMAPPFQIVMSGTLRVTLPLRSSHTKVKRSEEVTLNTLGRGCCFGEYSLLDEMPASASVVALTPGKLLSIPHARLQNLLAMDDRLAKIVYHNMLVELVGRLKRRESEVDRLLMV